MGVLPLEFVDGESAQSLEISGTEVFDLAQPIAGATELEVRMTRADGTTESFMTKVRIDTPKEWDYYYNGGILPYMVRQLLD
jgi:aconitate hydratase